MIRLTYFDHIWGRALAIRAMLRMSQTDFEDVRLHMPELETLRGPTGRSDAVPLGFLPTISFPRWNDFQVRSQSQAIARWAAKKADLYPADAELALFVDDVVQTTLELTDGIPPSNFRSGDKEDEALADWLSRQRDSYLKTTVPKYLEYLSDQLSFKEGPFLLGDTLSFADFVLFQFLYNVQDGRVQGLTFEKLTSTYPNFQRLFDAMLLLKPVQEELSQHKKIRLNDE